MTYKKLSILFFLLVFFTSLSAQRFNGGLLGGLSTSQVDGDTQKGFNKLGVFGGVFVETGFTEVIGAKIELMYIGKGAKMILDDIEIFNTSLHYVEMPFLMTIKPLDMVEFDLGLAISYLVGSKLDKLNETVPEDLYELHNFDVGGIITATYYLFEKTGINVRFEYSAMSIKDKPNWFNYNFSFGVVYKIK